MRSALGAGRERLARQLLTESLLLAGAGGALGVLLAFTALPLVVRLVPNALPIGEAPPLDLRILGFAGLMTLVTALGFGLAPVLRGLGDGAAQSLREGSRTLVGGRERLRSSLVVAEVAVSVVLLVSSGLLIRALVRVQSVDPGFQPAGVVTLRTALPMPKYQSVDKRAAFHAGVLEQVRALPGVASAAYISALPMVMTGGIWQIEAEGHPNQPGDERFASMRYVTPGYFRTLGIPIIAGRDVSDADTAGALQVAVVSRSFVERYWPGQNAIGRRFRFGLLGGETITAARPFQDRTIVGVVGDVKVRGLERRSEPQAYLPHRQQPEDAMGWYTPQDLAVRHTGDAASLVPALRRIVGRADPAQPVADVRTLETILEGQTAPRRVQVRVLAGFAALAVLLAGVGIHGLLAFRRRQPVARDRGPPGGRRPDARHPRPGAAAGPVARRSGCRARSWPRLCREPQPRGPPRRREPARLGHLRAFRRGRGGHRPRRQPAAGLAGGPGRPADGDPRRLAAFRATRFDARAGRP